MLALYILNVKNLSVELKNGMKTHNSEIFIDEKGVNLV